MNFIKSLKILSVVIPSVLICVASANALGVFYYDSANHEFVMDDDLRILNTNNLTLNTNSINSTNFVPTDPLYINGNQGVQIRVDANCQANGTGCDNHKFSINNGANESVFEVDEGGNVGLTVPTPTISCAGAPFSTPGCRNSRYLNIMRGSAGADNASIKFGTVNNSDEWFIGYLYNNGNATPNLFISERSQITTQADGLVKTPTMSFTRGVDTNADGILNESGNVGIGTTSPQAKLDVNLGNIMEGANNPEIRKVIFHANRGGGNDPTLNNDTGGGVRLELSHGSTGEIGKKAYIQSVSSYSYSENVNLEFGTSGNNTSGSTSDDAESTKMAILWNGNVGIGTTLPLSKLDVEGGLAVGATYSGTTAAPTNGLIVEGNVGIGTATPGSKLHLKGNGLTELRITGGDDGSINAGLVLEATQSASRGSGVFMYNDVDKIEWFAGRPYSTSDSYQIKRQVSMTEHNQNTAGESSGDDSVSLLTLSNAGQLSAASFLYSSDQTLKKDIKPLENTMSKLLNLNGVSFRWKDNHDDDLHIGLLAQQVEKEYPEVVSTNDQGIKSVDYAKLVPVLIEALKEVNDKVSTLENQVKILTTSGHVK